MTYPDFDYEQGCWEKGIKYVAGADEVGRGSFAGPVVASAVVFTPNYDLRIRNNELKINDSKKLTLKQREIADSWIRQNALAFGIGKAGVAQINKLGIKKATEIAYRIAVKEANKVLSKKDIRYSILDVSDKMFQDRISNIEYLLVDAFYIPRVPGIPKAQQKAIIKGDSISFSIAAASIIAKVYRDNLMAKLSQRYKRYSWHKNKGYGTLEHRNAILKYGISTIHRTQFVRTFLKKFED